MSASEPFEHDDQDLPFQPTEALPHGRPRVLVVAADTKRRMWMDRVLRQQQMLLDTTGNPSDAYRLLEPAQPAFDIVVLDLPACTPAAVRLVKHLHQRKLAAVVICPDLTFDQAVDILEAGATDIAHPDISARELTRRLHTALRVHALTEPRANDHLPESHTSHTWSDAVPPSSPNPAQPSRPSRPAHAQQVRNADPLANFLAVIERELDVESLLRHALEFALARIGPTNAAVFLPGSTGEYALGAYVNLSQPKDVAEVMFDHLANIAAPRLESTIGVIDLSDPEKMRDVIGDGAEWLAGQAVLAFSCVQEGDCLAVFVLFRERSAGFTAEHSKTLGAVREHFGKQLARVIKIHHRHLPRDKWGAVGDEWTNEDDEGGMAA